jgi:hypothetical protein
VLRTASTPGVAGKFGIDPVLGIGPAAGIEPVENGTLPA